MVSNSVSRLELEVLEESRGKGERSGRVAYAGCSSRRVIVERVLSGSSAVPPKEVGCGEE